jgi:thiamine pyrophosphokinase
MKAVILAGGELSVRPVIEALVKAAEFIVAADSGLDHAVTLEVKPDVIVGDFDSVSPEILEQFPDVPKKRYSRHKDLLDLEIALGVALEPCSVRWAGGLTSRLQRYLSPRALGAKASSSVCTGDKIFIYSSLPRASVTWFL